MLCRFECRDAPLEDALAVARDLGATCVLSYSPTACRLAALRDAPAESLAPAAYEARMFGDACEVRWVEGLGAVASGESLGAIRGWLGAEPEHVYVREGAYVLSHAAMVTGKQLSAELAHATQNQVCVVHVREYLGAIDRFGNVGIVAERLVGLGVDDVKRG